MNALQKIEGSHSPVRSLTIGLVVRCFAERKGDQWQAFSLEFGLASQADTFKEAKQKLEMMIVSYVYDALLGEDRKHAFDLLNRRATWRVYFNYYFYSCLHGIAKFLDGSKDKIFYSEPLALEPKLCNA